MLAQLTVRNFAIVDSIELELQDGMTVLTGETGAGKSILIDALALILGGRANATVVRPRAERAEVTGVFDINPSSAPGKWLAAQELDSPDGECVLRRTVGSDGRSRAFINGHAVPLQTLRGLGEQLVDIHGQHAHQSLTKVETQRQLLDGFANHDGLLAEVESLYQRWRDIDREIAEGLGNHKDRQSRLDYLRYQAKELHELGLEAGEAAQLNDELRRLSHAEELGQLSAGLLRVLAEDEAAVQSQLATAQKALQELTRLDPLLQGPGTLIEEAVIQVTEAVSELRGYAEGMEPDPERLDWVQRRIATIHDLARKHRVQDHELTALAASLDEQIEKFETAGVRLRELEKERSTLLKQYTKAQTQLHDSRIKAAQSLGKDVVKNIRELGMPDGRFEVKVELIDDTAPTPHGADRIEFLVSANPGQPLQPLSKVASGGELSRISLGLQVVRTRDLGATTLIFDEVDVGVGGGIAQMIGALLHQLGNRRQVLCVTHLAQVASQAHHHVRVHKQTAPGVTIVHLERLAKKERVEELARMLGGMEITGRTRAHAREMLDRAETL